MKASQSKLARFGPGNKKVKLNEREKIFIQNILKDPNGRKAAIAAGYSPKTAHVIAHQLLNKPLVIAALEEARARIAEKADVDAAFVLRETVRLYMRMETLIAEISESNRLPVKELYDEDGNLLHPNDFPSHWQPKYLIKGIKTKELYAYNPETNQKEFAGYTKEVILQDHLKEELALIAEQSRKLRELGELKVIGAYDKSNSPTHSGLNISLTVVSPDRNKERKVIDVTPASKQISE